MDKKQIRGALVLIAATFVILGTLSFTGTTGATAEAAQILSGSGQGYAGQITVEVIKQGDTVTAINVVNSDDTPGLSDGAFETIIEAVLANQTPDGVDIVSGATGSSEGILTAIRNALGAGEEEETAVTEETLPIVEGETYTGSARGYDSTITVEIIITDDGTIGAIEVVESGDTPGLSTNAFEAIIADVLSNQSVKGVDIVSGATGSSEGLLNAIAEALQQQ